MAIVRRSPQAEADLEAILDDLNQKNPAAADRYAAAFEEKRQALAQFPEAGRPRPELTPGLRSTLVLPYPLLPFRKRGSADRPNPAWKTGLAEDSVGRFGRIGPAVPPKRGP
jgi:plasmid stabilization system protein ParE